MPAQDCYCPVMKWGQTVFNSCTLPYISSYGCVIYVMLDSLYCSLYIYRMYMSKFSKAHELSWKMLRKYMFYYWKGAQMKLRLLMACWHHGKCMRDVQMEPIWSHAGLFSIPAVAHELYNRTDSQANRSSATLLNANIPVEESVQMSSHSVPSTNLFHLKTIHTVGSSTGKD
jgi:hypothetical protein